MQSSEKKSNIFSGLEHLGFNNINNIEIYYANNKNTNTTNNPENNSTNPIDDIEKEKMLLYDKEIICPVCKSKFKARSVKTSSARVLSKDSDFFIRYGNINPYFYDVWLCNICGYASMKKDFEKIKEHQIEKIQNEISNKWRGRNYPEVYNLDIAIERFKLSLLNYCIINAKSSFKAMNCLKLAWMFRLKEDNESELNTLKQALDGFNNAFETEDFPIYGMDEFTLMYLIAELNFRTNNYSESLIWFGKILSSTLASPKIKDLAKEQKDLVNETIKKIELENETTEEEINENKEGLFSRFFKKRH